MILPDLNVLLYAFRRDAERHAEYRSWLHSAIQSERPYGMSPQVLASLVRIATYPRVFRRPSQSKEALAIASGCQWITTDRDYARFDGLRWAPPF
jgi:predicted nucleic acid-binding protein